jgi:hypothetical protein
VRDDSGRPGFRTRQLTLVTTRLDAASSRVADRAECSRQPRAPLKTTRPMEVRHGQTGPGVLKARTGLAIVDHLVRRVLGPSASRQHLGVEASACWRRGEGWARRAAGSREEC